jgi:excisionase family DNA binding protein
MDGTSVMTAREVAAELRISRALVYRMAREGKLPSTRVTRSQRPQVRFRRAELEEYLRQINERRNP